MRGWHPCAGASRARFDGVGNRRTAALDRQPWPRALPAPPGPAGPGPGLGSSMAYRAGIEPSPGGGPPHVARSAGLPDRRRDARSGTPASLGDSAALR